MVRTPNQSSTAPQPPVFPAWARIDAPIADTDEAAYRAGASLALLSACVRAEAPFAGVWRRRLALKAAAASVRMIRRGENEAMLRDSYFLRQGTSDPGPAGKLLLAWRGLERSVALDPGAVVQAAAQFGLREDEALRDAIAAAQASASSDRGAPFAAAAAASAVLAHRPDAELLALWLADAVLAARLKWPLPLALIADSLQQADLRKNVRGRPHPADANWTLICCAAYARAAAQACQLFADLGRRAATLQTIAPRLRAKGASIVIEALLNEDAVLPSTGAGTMTDRAMRRLFDRLAALGGVRELTGRSTYRLYGL